MVKFQARLRADEKCLIALVVGPIGGLLDGVFRRVRAGSGRNGGDAQFGCVGCKGDDAVASGQSIEGVICDGVENRGSTFRCAYSASFDFMDKAFAQALCGESHT